VRHQVTPTNAEMIEHVTPLFTEEYQNTKLAKQLFLYDKKKKENMFLVCAQVDTEVNMKALEKHFKVGSGNLRGADAGSLEKYLGCRQGTVNYFSIINDTEKKVKLMMDKKLLDAEWASFHPMDNSGSTCINKEGILKIKEVGGRDDTNWEIMDFSAVAPAAAKPAAGGAAK